MPFVSFCLALTPVVVVVVVVMIEGMVVVAVVRFFLGLAAVSGKEPSMRNIFVVQSRSPKHGSLVTDYSSKEFYARVRSLTFPPRLLTLRSFEADSIFSVHLFPLTVIPLWHVFL